MNAFNQYPVSDKDRTAKLHSYDDGAMSTDLQGLGPDSELNRGPNAVFYNGRRPVNEYDLVSAVAFQRRENGGRLTDKLGRVAYERDALKSPGVTFTGARTAQELKKEDERLADYADYEADQRELAKEADLNAIGAGLADVESNRQHSIHKLVTPQIASSALAETVEPTSVDSRLTKV